MPAKVADRTHLVYEWGARSKKVFYSLSHDICNEYMHCLLIAEKLHSKGVKRIPHFVAKGAKKFFCRLLEGDDGAAAAVFSQPLVPLQDVDDDEPACQGRGVNDDDSDGADNDDENDDEPVSREPSVPNDEVNADDSWINDFFRGLNLSEDDGEEVPVAAPPVSEIGSASPREHPLQDDALRVDHTPPSHQLLPPHGRWGCFRFTAKHPGSGRPHGGYEVHCPLHQKSKRTGCKKYLAMRENTDVERSKVILALQGWCTFANSYQRQRDHVRHFVSAATAPSESWVQARIIENGPSHRVYTDEELDQGIADNVGADDAEPSSEVRAGEVAEPSDEVRVDAGRGGRARGRGRGKRKPEKQPPQSSHPPLASADSQQAEAVRPGVVASHQRIATKYSRKSS